MSLKILSRNSIWKVVSAGLERLLDSGSSRLFAARMFVMDRRTALSKIATFGSNLSAPATLTA
jgi:hypothetical protein